MAANLPPLVLEVVAKTDQLTAKLNGVQKQVKDVGGAAHENASKVSSFGGSLKGLAVAAAAAVSIQGIISLMQAAGKAAADDATSSAILSNQITNVTGASREQQKQIEQNISSLEMMSGVADDHLRPALATLVRSTNDTTKAQDLLRLSLDIAAGTGRDVESVSQALGKAYNGNSAQLQRLVPAVKNAKDQMGYLRDTFAGAAEKAADTNPYARVQVAMDHLYEALGTLLLPAIQSFSDWLVDVTPRVEAFFASMNTKQAQTAWNELTNAMSGFAQGWDDLGGLKMPNLFEVLPKFLTYLTYGADLAGWSIARLGTILQAFFNKDFALMSKLINNYQKDFDTFASNKWGDITSKSDYSKIFGGGGVFPEGFFPSTGTPKKTGSGTSTSSAASSTKSAYAAFHASIVAIQKSVTAATAQYNTDMAALSVSHANNLASIQADYGNQMAALTADHMAKVAQIQQDGADRLAQIVQQSKDLLRNAFQQATSFDVGSIFAASLASSSSISSAVSSQMKNGISTAVSWWGASGSKGTTGGVAGLLETLNTKLTAAKTLADNAGKLAAAGYSQGFIQQVMSQGADVGNTMAQQLLSADPAMQKQVQQSFAALDTITQTGVDKLANTLYTTNGLATAALRKMYADTQAETAKALAAENAAYAAAMGQLQAAMDAALAQENQRFMEEQAKLKATLDAALIDANDKLVAALAKASDALGGHMGKLKSKYKQELADLKAAIAEANALINATPATVSGIYMGTGIADRIAAQTGTAGVAASATTYNINTTAVTTADPNAISTAMVNATKFNTPMIVPPSLAAQMGVAI